MSDPTFSDLIAFTRASVAWVTNPDGQLEQVPVDTPRFDYDAASRAPRGLLLESGGENPDGSLRAGDVAKVTLNTDWFDPTRGVWIVTFEFPGAGQHTAIEVNAGGILMGIRVTDGNVYAYRGSEMHGLDAALPGGSTRVVLGYGQRGAFAARNGTVVQLSMARTPRIADVCLGVSVAAMLQLDSRMISFGYVGVDATSAEIAAYSALDEWGELIAYIGANFIDGFIATASQLNTAINT